MSYRTRTGPSPENCWMKNNGISGYSRTKGYAPPRRSRTYIAFDELPDENWAIAGKLLHEE